MSWKPFLILIGAETVLFLFSLSWALWATQILEKVQDAPPFDFENTVIQEDPPGFALFFLQFLKITYLLVAMFSLYSVPLFYQLSIAPGTQTPKGFARSFSMILILILEVFWVLLFFMSPTVLMIGGLETFGEIEYFTKAYLVTSVIICIIGGIAYKINESLSSKSSVELEEDLQISVEL